MSESKFPDSESEPLDTESKAPDSESKNPTRRQFLGKAGGATAGAIALGTIGLGPLLGSKTAEVLAQTTEDCGPQTGIQRANSAFEIRVDAAQAERNVPIPSHNTNGDEERFTDKRGNYSKGLGHNPSTGDVNLDDYAAYRAAICSGQFSQIEALANGNLGCPFPERQRRLVNPLAGLAFDLEGTDSHQLDLRPAPAFRSAEEAGEMVELYWMSLLRDVNFRNYATNPTAQAAADDLSNLSVFRGPKEGGRVTTQTLFRDTYPGCTTGPYISQFLLQPAPFGAQRVDQRILTNRAGIDFMTSFTEWLDVQNGCQPTRSITPDGLVFCRNGRDLSQYVHIDVLFQAYFVAALILLSGGYLADAGNPYGQIIDGGAGNPLPPGASGARAQVGFGTGNPLPPGASGARAQVGFGTFGGPAIATLVCEPSTRALKDVWYQKWLVHRRLRPEEFGGRVEVERLGLRNYGIHNDLNNSTVLPRVFSKGGSYLLPMAFPEGSPMHTAYGAGHATVAGASVTMLKALLDETQIVRNPVMPNNAGTELVPFVGPPLTVGGELNKLASNISTGRNIAGVHWRTDGVESVKLGEATSISILRDMFATYAEPFEGFSLTKFDGTTITIAGNP